MRTFFFFGISLWIIDLLLLKWQLKVKRKKAQLHKHIDFYFKLKSASHKPQNPESNLAPSQFMPNPWALPEVGCWESVWAPSPGLFKWLFPLPAPRLPPSTPVCQASSAPVQAFCFWSRPPVKGDADLALRTSLPCCCLQGPKPCWFTLRDIIFSLYLLVVLFSFRHLLTWELEIKSAFHKDEKVVSHFLPAHMKGLPSGAWRKTRTSSTPWVLQTGLLFGGTAHLLVVQKRGDLLQEAAVRSKGLEDGQGEWNKRKAHFPSHLDLGCWTPTSGWNRVACLLPLCEVIKRNSQAQRTDCFWHETTWSGTFIGQETLFLLWTKIWESAL